MVGGGGGWVVFRSFFSNRFPFDIHHPPLPAHPRASAEMLAGGCLLLRSTAALSFFFLATTLSAEVLVYPTAHVIASRGTAISVICDSRTRSPYWLSDQSTLGFVPFLHDGHLLLRFKRPRTNLSRYRNCLRGICFQRASLSIDCEDFFHIVRIAPLQVTSGPSLHCSG